MMETTVAESAQKAFILPTRVMEALGGNLYRQKLSDREVTLVEGAFLWGVDPLELGKRVLNHSLMVGRGAWCLASAIKARSEVLGDGLYTDKNLNQGKAAEAGCLHDVGKLPYGKAYFDHIALGIEDLTPEEKESLGYPADFREISAEADKRVADWLREHGCPSEVVETVIGHDFPEDEGAIGTIYQRIVMWADYSCGQSFTPVRERLDDIWQRWIIKYVTNLDELEVEGKSPVEIVRDHWQELKFAEDQSPRIEPERAAKAVEVIEKATSDLFSYLGMTEDEFISQYCLNDSRKMSPWERTIRRAWEKDYSHQQVGGRGTPRSNQVREIIEKRVFNREPN